MGTTPEFASAHEIRWYVDRRVLLVRLIGNGTLGDAKALIDRTNAILADAPAPVYVLVDCTRLALFVSDMLAVRKVLRNDHPAKLHSVHLICAPRVLAAMLRVLLPMVRASVYMHANMPEALRAVHQAQEKQTETLRTGVLDTQRTPIIPRANVNAK